MKYFLSAFFLLSFFFVTSQIYAGGGQYQPINFSWGQVINGTSLSVEVAVMKDDFSGYAAGEDFEIIAHHDLPGAQCQTTQRTADGNGRVKGFCKADGTGRFVFEVQPVSRQSVQSGASFEVFFSNTSSSTGFSEQGTQSSEKVEAVIIQSPGKAEVGKTFTVEVKAKKDGQVLDDTSLIQSVRWTVLKGSMVTTGSEGSGNRKLSIFTDQRDTVIIADVTLSSGEQVKTPSKTLQFAAPPSPVMKPSPSPTPQVKQDVAPSTPAPEKVPDTEAVLNSKEATEQMEEQSQEQEQPQEQTPQKDFLGVRNKELLKQLRKQTLFPFPLTFGIPLLLAELLLS